MAPSETIRFMITSPGESALPYYSKMFGLVVLYVGMIIAIVAITQGQRRIPIQQARHTRGNRVYGGQRHFLPIRVNQAGVMPIIFASSLLMFPQMILSLSPALEPYANYLSGGSFWYVIGEVALIVFFSFFWVGLMFQPEEMSNNMKEYGSFVPGIRPGRNTSLFLEGVMNRITFAGGFILALIAIGPTITIAVLGLTGVQARFAYFLGGTGILIVVGVVLDLVQKIESYLLMRHYEGFMKKGRIRGRR